MRTIVAFLFAAGVLAAKLGAQPQPAEIIERQEKRLVQNPDDLNARAGLLSQYLGNSIPIEKAREARRRHITWLIEHHPDADALGRPEATIDPKGEPVADPEGYADAARLWKEQAGKREASPKTIANAAFFLGPSDRETAFTVLDPAWRAHPGDPMVARARARLDVMTMLGVTGMNARGQVTVNADLRQSPEAVKAREEIDSSTDAVLVGSAGQSLIQLLNSIRVEPRRFLPFVSSSPEPEDLSPVAELWLTRARELAPGNTAWNDGLVQVYQRRAGQIQDPRGKVKFLSEADTVANDNQRANLLPNLAMAEFEAGDDAAAARDAQRLLDLAPKSPSNRENMIHAGNTILGRVALAKKDVNEAKERLLASARVAGSPVLNSFGPRMELAQDLLDVGQRDAVLQYLEMCRAFWTYDQGQLDHKIKLVKSPGNPDLIQRWTPPGMHLVGKKAPTFALKDLSGKEWNLDQLAGKTIALEFFTTSCKSCGEELAMLASRQELVTLAVNVGESEDALREFAGQNHLPMPVLIGGKDSAILRYEVDTYPTLAIIDRNGLVALYRAGRGANVKADLERGAAGVPIKTIPSTPVQLTPPDGAVFAGVPRKLTLNWEPVEGADSYVVEWDYRDAKGWVSEHNGGLTPVIPTREPSATLDFIGARPGRWRVYAVSSAGDAGKTSAWREFEYKR